MLAQVYKAVAEVAEDDDLDMDPALAACVQLALAGPTRSLLARALRRQDPPRNAGRSRALARPRLQVSSERGIFTACDATFSE